MGARFSVLIAMREVVGTLVLARVQVTKLGVIHVSLVWAWLGPL